ncbi:Cif family virulence factor [Spirosoma endbachense]|uniref:SnoaL-like domain-containing protein n=1 Tax=Spirosoma endbachense TaxID=2666025 RepID=A0A6P1VRM7_9BACT|nr:nuclear transport factor 2 family protein [Spirosoma endbachense]QHV95733.1 hypothetical protein GJR95_12245 [Spirosoma endbachense]
MKAIKPFLFSLLLAFGSTSYGQATFTKVTFDDLMARYDKDPIKFLKTETAPDFQFLGSTIEDVNGTLAIYDRLQQLKRDYAAVNVRQYGQTGVATGLLTHMYAVKSSGNPYSIRELFTYVFTNEKGNTWKLVSAQHRPFVPPVADDEAAIKKVLEGLTAAVYARDFKTYLSHWADTKYASRIGSDLGNVVTKMVGDEYRKLITEAATKPGEPSKDKVTRENYLIRVNGGSAFVIFDQYNTRPDGTIRHSVEERYLERMNEEWKIVNVTVLVAK